MNPYWTVNVVVALSNAYALRPIATFLLHRWPLSGGVVVVAMLASTMQHLSETKHGLPGIGRLRHYDRAFLNLDRGVAIGTAAFFLVLAFRLGAVRRLLPLVSIGMLFMAVSEHGIALDRPWLFAATHSIWHLCAFHSIQRLAALATNCTIQ